jgi:hypothetical protein
MPNRPPTRQELDERYRRGEISEKDYGRALLELAASGDATPASDGADEPLPNVRRSFAPVLGAVVGVLAAAGGIVVALLRVPAPSPTVAPPLAVAPAAAPAEDNAASGEAAVAPSGSGRDYVSAVVRAHNDEVRACIDQETGLHGGMKGRIDTEFVIAADGKVVYCEAASDGGLTAATKCVCERLRTWRFPARKGGNTMTVRYPFAFAME